MLVVARKPNESIVFPGLGITVTLLSFRGKSARIGVDAHRDVSVLRDELAHDTVIKHRRPESVMAKTSETAPRDAESHRIRNVLNSVSLAAMLYKCQIDAGQHQDAAKTFEKMLEFLDEQTKSGDTAFEIDFDNPSNMDGHVVVVEDDDRQRGLLTDVLSMHGLEVSSFDNGQSALRRLRKERNAGVLLLDWNMPRCDGNWLLSQIHEALGCDRPKVFVVSGEPPADLHVRDSVDEWIPKPVNHDLLIAKLRAAYAVAT